MPLLTADISKILENAPSVGFIRLAGRALTDTDVIQTLVPLLQKNSYITEIDLGSNSIGDAGAMALAEYASQRQALHLQDGKTKLLHRLILDKNARLSDQGSMKLINSPIACLVFSRTSVGEETALFAVQAKQLELNINLNNIDKKLLKLVNEQIAKNNAQNNVRLLEFKEPLKITPPFFSQRKVIISEEERKSNDSTPKEKSSPSDSPKNK